VRTDALGRLCSAGDSSDLYEAALVVRLA
jgi:hypothetical protein